jgi:twitching motility protein PilU
MKLSELLKIAVDNEAIDLFLMPKSPPMMRVKDDVIPVIGTHLTSFEIQQVVDFMTSDNQKAEFESTSELNFAYEREDIGRFRVNVFKSHSGISVVFRIVKLEIPTVDELRLPHVLQDIIMEERGLVFIVGAVGSGKSTTMAALLNYRNMHRNGHILTIEDPLEFLHIHKRSIFSQREVGIDTESYENALKNVLRQSPDVIAVGEVRDVVAMNAALHYAETGHLMITTLHAVNSYQAFERMINFYPAEFRDNILLEIAANIKAVISQRLIPRADGTGRVVAVGVLRDSPRVKDLIAKGSITEISAELEKRNTEGVTSIDQAIFKLHEEGLITAEDALRYADRPNNMAIKIRQLENTLRQRQEVDKLRHPRDQAGRLTNV